MVRVSWIIWVGSMYSQVSLQREAGEMESEEVTWRQKLSGKKTG